jgi:hypothetical protein
METTIDFTDYENPLHVQLPVLTVYSISQLFEFNSKNTIEVNTISLYLNTLDLKDHII